MWIARLVPGPLVRFFAAPYVAGSSIDAALDCASDLWSASRLHATLDLLGEDIADARQIEANRQTYAKTIRFAAQDPRLDDAARPTVSVKPSAFTVGPQADALAHLEALARLAYEHDVPFTVDMEDRRWTDFTLDAAVELFGRGWDVGTVLQTRLHRTEADLERIPSGMRVRLVIGIYPEPTEFAVTDKAIMKERLLDYAQRLLARGARVEFATHDEEILRRFAKYIAPAAPERCEVQLLLGVPREAIQAELASGVHGAALPVRLYVPFAIGWDSATAYLRRRMAESPGMVFLVLRNLLAPRRKAALPAPSRATNVTDP